MEVKDILVINPGSTSTKIAVYRGEGQQRLLEKNIVHDDEAINAFSCVAAQKDYRKNMILEFLQGEGYDLKNLSAVVGRGGMSFQAAAIRSTKNSVREWQVRIFHSTLLV